MSTPSHNPDRRAYKSALGDVLLRTLFALIILAAGYWVPSSYLLEKYGIFAQFGPGALAEAAFFVSKFAAFFYGVMALWSLGCAFVALWYPSRTEPAQRGGCT